MDIIDILKKVNAVITNDHFVYTSGKHGEVYINKDALYPHTKETSEVGNMFAEKYKDSNVDVVVGPALGGIILSTWIAFHLSQLTGREILGVYTEKDEEKNQIFTRGYDKLITGKNVLIIEDLTTTGGSVKKVVDTVKNAGGTVTAVCVMVNRNPDEVNSEIMGVPFDALGVLPAKAYDESECPFCKEDRPVNTDVGHGRKYMEAKKN
ncbi:phosphoribosyltransferase [Candidatus Roizmanbacteria bacterium CG_4_10_14_0_2_um_filter_39_13]|uniref:Orotate phosphoribosyltransferase n=1 Tax=Candidatus Roizmanbacteria bacterium CG_4_10_14_0_2_um_filter_39_13 TaxID=1974825 RepID=A0A2M7TVV3_9BACT|nr:MAG: phosphoribosyltransferase [Candidatus Roizmanbacteria bacterium CG_4_10_14_0_2_um_filter_39_13]